MRPGFSSPDFAAPIDPVAQKRLIPAGATVKGMQLQGIADDCARRGASLGLKRFVAFRDYPAAELLDVLVLATEKAFVGIPPREALRRIGRVAYPTLKNSLVGRIVFGALGSDPEKVWRLVPKGYAISGSTGSVEIIELLDSEVVLRFDGIYSFIDSWHVGIMEGAVELYGMIPTVFIEKQTPTRADMAITWEPSPLR